MQRLGQGPSRVHLDLHVHDVGRAAEAALVLGAVVVDRPELGYAVLRSPGGLTFCFVRHRAVVIPPSASWSGVGRSRVYQVCLDVPPASYDAECAFWAGLVGGTVEVLRSRPEFSWSRGPRQLALDVLLQRLEVSTGSSIEPDVSAHLDLGTTDRQAEVARHVALGARAGMVEEFWTVLSDPAGLAYCVTDRDPATGRLR